jgi:hypothetical protein
MVPFHYPLHSTWKKRRAFTVKRDASSYTGVDRHSVGSFVASLRQLSRTTMIGARVGVRLPDGLGSAVTRTAWTPRVVPGTLTEPVLVVKSADVGTGG